jgi:hypothetical protein
MRFRSKLALENEILKKGLSRYHSSGGTPRSVKPPPNTPRWRLRSYASCFQ